MLVKIGFNTDYGKDKFDVGLDETDLARILVEADIPPDAQLTSREAFLVLHCEAERFCAGQRAIVDPGSADHWRREVRRLGEQLAVQLGKITTRLGPLPDDEQAGGQ